MEAAPARAVSGVLVEVCVDSIDGALEAAYGGANRLELCGELLQGGVTPSAGLIGAVWECVEIPVFVIIRPRPGDFLYTHDERDVMLRDIEFAKSQDVDGVVFGALTAEGEIDVDAMRELVDAAGALDITFHRAFDFVRDQQAALEALIDLGVDRVLTSGGAPSALEGAEMLAKLQAHAGDALTILAGGSVTADNVSELVRRSGVWEVHVRATRTIESGMTHRRREITLARPAPGGDYSRIVTHADEVARVIANISVG